MHRPVKENLEEYLQAAGSACAPAEMDSHLKGCRNCRGELEDMAAQARLLRELRGADDIGVAPGFYARVMAAVETSRRASGLLAFTESSFGRRFVYACLTAVILLGSYLLYTELSSHPFGNHNPVRLMVADTPRDRHFGTDQQRDREAVLMSLASYRE